MVEKNKYTERLCIKCNKIIKTKITDTPFLCGKCNEWERNKQSPLKPTHLKIIKILTQNPLGMRYKDISTNTGIPYSSLCIFMERLVAQKYVEKVNGLYKLATKKTYTVVEKLVVEKNVYDYLTVRQLIKKLLDVENLDLEVYITDKEGNRLHNVSIMAKEGQGLGCLFG